MGQLDRVGQGAGGIQDEDPDVGGVGRQGERGHKRADQRRSPRSRTSYGRNVPLTTANADAVDPLLVLGGQVEKPDRHRQPGNARTGTVGGWVCCRDG